MSLVITLGADLMGKARRRLARAQKVLHVFPVEHMFRRFHFLLKIRQQEWTNSLPNSALCMDKAASRLD